MKKNTKMFNELILLAETKKVKKGGGLAAVLKLIQDMTEFENSIQECMDAQDMAEYKSKIEGFLNDIDKMYGVLFDMAKTGIQSMRTERGQVVEEKAEDIMDEKPSPATNPPTETQEQSSPRTFTIDQLKREMEKASPPSSAKPIKMPEAPEKLV